LVSAYALQEGNGDSSVGATCL